MTSDGVSASLSQLVGARKLIDGTATLDDPGTVMIVLKNAKAVKVLRAGRKYKRGWGLPIFGRIDAIPVSTAAHVVNVEVSDVGTASLFHLPNLTATFELQLKETEDWSPLLEYVRKQGLNFAERLTPRVKSELQSLVKDTLKDYTYESLHRSNLKEFLVPANTLILGGLFEIIGVEDVNAKWNENYSSMLLNQEDAVASVARGEQDTVAHVKQAEYRQIRELADLNTDAALAEAKGELTGLGAGAYLDSKRYDERFAARIDLTKEVINNYQVLMSPRGADFLERAVGGLQATSSGGPSTPQGAAGPQGALGTDFPTPDLTLDTDLAPVFKECGVWHCVKGLAFGRRDGSSAVVCVTTSPDRVEAVRSNLEQYAADVLKSQTELFVFPFMPSLPGLVAVYLITRLPELAESQARFLPRLKNGHLQLVMDVPSRRVSDFYKVIRDPRSLVLEPLQALLPYDSVDVVLAEQ